MLLAERYRTSEILGHGGMGEVYRGCDEILGRPVAVKLLRPDLRDPFAAARFQREARAAAMVRDPHVVAVYDFGHSNGEYYLVMELLEGRSVAHELALHGPLPPDRAVGIVQQVARGLAAAHRHGIVHRDIKPDNLLIDVDGSVKIADFGIAHSPGGTITPASSGLILGTSLYLAPERALGQPATPATDVYALGCVLYQLLTGRPPFEGENPTVVLSQHVQATPTVPEEVPAPVADLIRRMLAKEPAERPTTDEVASWAFTDPRNATTAELPPLPLRRNRRAVFVGLAALIALLAAVIAGVLTSQSAGTPPAPTDVAPSRTPQPTAPSPTMVTTPAATATKVTTTKAPPATSARPTARTHATSQPAAKQPPGKHKPKPGKTGKR
ncbi:protein kinase [Kribbella sp. NPDC003505]|uniref:serine/threonine-protein kinase n=1 Tax=Kribbella sp. NPDC003505 TaxID=3154448 RepID=UPI0033A47C38